MAGGSTRRGLIVAALVLLALAVVLVVMTLQVRSARDDLTAAQDQVSELQDAVEGGDQAGAVRALTIIQDRAGRARSTLGQPQWAIAARMPFLGDDISAVRTVTTAVDAVGTEVLPMLVDLSDQLNADVFKPKDGVFDFGRLRSAAASLLTAKDRYTAAVEPVADIRPSSLIGSLGPSVREAQDKLAEGSVTLSSIATVADILPDMAEGDHDYLVVFQNNAELRAQGGLPGAWAQLKIRNGAVSVGAQGAGSKTITAEPVEELTLSELKAFGPDFTKDFRDTNLTPDVPTSSALQAKMVAATADVQTDGVISLDPVTLSYLLKAIGPVKVNSTVTLTSENAVEFLLNKIYLLQPDPDKQDAFFAVATRKIFSSIAGGSFDATTLAKALTRAARERRISVWSKDESVESRLARTTVGGVLPTAKEQPAIGVYINDATKAKMSYYIDFSSSATAVACSETGVQTYSMTATVASHAPADAATLPSYIVGDGKPPGSMRVYLQLLGPVGGTRPVVSVGGQERDSDAIQVNGRPGSRFGVLLTPGTALPITATMTSAPGQRGDTKFAQTPTISSGVIPGTIPSACS